MKNIEIGILNPEAIQDCENMAVAMARMTQHSVDIHNLQDLVNLIKQPYSETFLHTLVTLPHPTLQKFGVINVGIVGASRRFLAQITRHQNEVKFMSGSLQYSDYTGNAQFVVPYEVTAMDAEHKGNAEFVDNYNTTQYLNSCNAALRDYERAIEQGIPHDDAAYMMPQGLRNVLVISALPFQWAHMISQRICNRNTSETQYILLRIWEELQKHTIMFDSIGAFCMTGRCLEGKMCCGTPLSGTPTQILNTKFKYIRGQ